MRRLHYTTSHLFMLVSLHFTNAIGPISDFFSILLQVIHSPMSPGVGKQIGQSLALGKGQANVQSVPLY